MVTALQWGYTYAHGCVAGDVAAPWKVQERNYRLTNSVDHADHGQCSKLCAKPADHRDAGAMKLVLRG